MNVGVEMGDIGLIMTKAPLESTLTKKYLELAEKVLKDNKSIGIFLISDGVFLIKKDQKNTPYNIMKKLLENNVEVIVSNDHLESAGISHDEILPNVKVSEKPYDDLVDFVMEKYKRVVTL